MIVYVLVEGQSEETFIKNCLYPYLLQFGIYAIPVVVSTKRILSGLKTTGGLTNGNLKRFLSDLRSLLHSVPPNGIVTTLIDFYAIPTDFPGYEHLESIMSGEQKAEMLQQSLYAEFDGNNSLLPYIQMYEFEALLFCHPSGFENNIDPTIGNVSALIQIINDYENPEKINNKKETSPSHRILKHYPTYKKNLMGNIMLLDIGIDQILLKCPRFKVWIDSIVQRKVD